MQCIILLSNVYFVRCVQIHGVSAKENRGVYASVGFFHSMRLILSPKVAHYIKRVKILQKKAVFNEITVDHFLKRKIAKKAASFAVFFSLHESK